MVIIAIILITILTFTNISLYLVWNLSSRILEIELQIKTWVKLGINRLVWEQTRVLI